MATLLDAWQREAEPSVRRELLHDWISVHNERLSYDASSDESVNTATALLTMIIGLVAKCRAQMKGSGPNAFFTSPHRLAEITAVYSIAWHALLKPARADTTVRKQILTFFASAFSLHPAVELPPVQLQACVLTCLFADATSVSERVESWKLLCRDNRGNGLTQTGPHWVDSLLGSVELRKSASAFLPAVCAALRDGRGTKEWVPLAGEAIAWLILPMSRYDDSRSVVVELCVEPLLRELTLGYKPGRATASWAARTPARTSAYGAALATLQSLLEPEAALEEMQFAAKDFLRRRDDYHPSSHTDLVTTDTGTGTPAPWISSFMPDAQWQEQLAWAARFSRLLQREVDGEEEGDGGGEDVFQPIRDDDAVSNLYSQAFETAVRLGQSGQQLTLAQMATDAAALAPFSDRKSQVLRAPNAQCSLQNPDARLCLSPVSAAPPARSWSRSLRRWAACSTRHKPPPSLRPWRRPQYRL